MTTTNTRLHALAGDEFLAFAEIDPVAAAIEATIRLSKGSRSKVPTRVLAACEAKVPGITAKAAKAVKGNKGKGKAKTAKATVVAVGNEPVIVAPAKPSPAAWADAATLVDGLIDQGDTASLLRLAVLVPTKRTETVLHGLGRKQALAGLGRLWYALNA